MRVVTTDARLHRVVGDRVDLRKAGRTGRIVGMANRAESPLSGGARLGLGIIDMRLCRAVTRFTRDGGVEAPLDFRPLIVTVQTGVRTGVSERLGDLSLDRRPLV